MMSKNKILVSAMLTGMLCLGGCRLISTADYQKLQNPETPLLQQTDEIFHSSLTPQIKGSAFPISELFANFAGQNDFAALCRRYGFRHAEEQQCNFPVRVEGTITAVKTNTRRGTITVTTAAGDNVLVQIGPVIMGTALRDIHKEVSYTDFNDQTVYGNYGDKINALSVAVAEALTLEEGQTVEVFGAFSSWDIPDINTIRVAPVEIIIK